MENENGYSAVLNTIKNLLIAIVILLIINLLVVILVNGDTKDTEKTEKTETPTETETETGEYDVSMFETIDLDGLKDTFNSDEIEVVYFGRPTCSYCVQFLPVLQKAQSEFGYTTKYVDISTISEDDAEEIKDMDDFLNENYGTTPLVILVKDGKLIEGHIGYAEYDTFVEFLNDNGIKN